MNLNDFDITTHSGLYISKDEQITKIDREIVINGAVEIEKMKEKRENGRDK